MKAKVDFCAAPLDPCRMSDRPPSVGVSVIVEPSTATNFMPATLDSQAGFSAGGG